jgi:hypothetical protein
MYIKYKKKRFEILFFHLRRAFKKIDEPKIRPFANPKYALYGRKPKIRPLWTQTQNTPFRKPKIRPFANPKYALSQTQNTPFMDANPKYALSQTQNTPFRKPKIRPFANPKYALSQTQILVYK